LIYNYRHCISSVFVYIDLVPDDTSFILRYIIKTLFVIHTETKLNMICPIGIDPQQRYGRPYKLVWCIGLKHPSISTTVKN
jgi:hypothetical protein